MTLRIGAVSYLNTKPLICGLRSRLPDADLILDLPSRLSERLHAGDLDVALIPSVDFLRSDSFSIVSDACIACRGAVRSVRMLFRTPPEKVTTIALDEGSRTSAVLAQVLLAQRYGIHPETHPLPIDADLADVEADALVVIGDRAMRIAPSQYHRVWDLGDVWTKQTGLPFVFAMWVSASSKTLPPGISDALQVCRDDGLSQIDTIVTREAPRYSLTEQDCRKYFTEQLYFYLGQRELDGVELFRSQAVELGLVPKRSSELLLQSI